MSARDFPDRKAMLAKAHIARKELGLDDESYRSILVRITGRESSGKCTRPQLVDLLGEFKRLGWKGSAPARHRPASDKAHVRKVFALWKDLCDAGCVRIPSRAGLMMFCRRMAGVDDPEWLTPDQAAKVIEGLKAWRARGHG